MNTRRLWIGVMVAAVLVLATGGAAALPGVTAPQATVASKINYQGRLTDTLGNPLDGTFPMRFQLYDAASGGNLLWDSGSFNVAVDNGNFSTDLNVDAWHFDGQGLWLRIWVDGDWLSPRHELVPVPYALNLRPGAEMIADASSNWLFRASNTSPSATGSAIWGSAATGTAVYGNSTSGYGLRGYSADSYAVYGHDGGSSHARGYGGYFTSDNGIGVYGHSSALTEHPNTYATGVYGHSNNGVGVHGVTDGSSWPAYGVYGQSQNSDGIYGYSGSWRGVVGQSSSNIGVQGMTNSLLGFGVVGLGTDHSSGDLPSGFWRPGGMFYGRNGVIGMTKTDGGYAVLGYSNASSGGYAGVFQSEAGDGVWIDSPAGTAALVVSGGTKNAAVDTSDGSRLLYSEESTEVWFSDYGFGQLQEGQAVITIDPLFAQTVNLKEPYHVFVQVYGDAEVYVTDRTPTEFQVHLRDGDPNVEFSYRLVAKRLGYEEDRLEQAPRFGSDWNGQAGQDVEVEQEGGQP